MLYEKKKRGNGRPFDKYVSIASPVKFTGFHMPPTTSSNKIPRCGARNNKVGELNCVLGSFSSPVRYNNPPRKTALHRYQLIVSAYLYFVLFLAFARKPLTFSRIENVAVLSSCNYRQSKYMFEQKLISTFPKVFQLQLHCEYTHKRKILMSFTINKTFCCKQPEKLLFIFVINFALFS